MTNTPNRRRRERATEERADSILEKLRHLPHGLEHRRQLEVIRHLPPRPGDTDYERLRAALTVDPAVETRFRGLLAEHEAPSAETVSALLEQAATPRPVELGEVHYAPGANPRPPLLGHRPRSLEQLEAWLITSEGQSFVENLARVSGWSDEGARDALRSAADLS